MPKTFAIIALLLASVAPLLAADPQRPNVLLIIADDMNARFGCYGDPIVKTPNIDKLAARGVRFDRAYCQYPVCNPSRVSFLSGMYPDATGVLNQSALLRTHMPDAVFLPEHFKANGYFTAGIGKVEHGGHYEIKWDLADDFKSAGDDDEDEQPRPPRGQRTRTRQQGVLSYETRRATEDNDPENVDDQIAAKVIALMEEHKTGPFFIVAGFHKPHVPHVAPKKFFDLYPPQQMQLIPVFPGDADDIPAAALASRRNYQPDMSDDRKRAIMSAYYACTSYFDAKVGEVMQAMDRLDLWDNTIVVLLGDHGWHLGEHNWWAKASLFEPSARAPLIIAAPGVKPAACGRVVEFVDLYPTLAAMCQLPPPPARQSQGRNIEPLLTDPQQAWDSAAVTALSTRGRSIRDERYRYTEWDQGKAGVELYDYDSDPGENANLAKDAKHADAVERMKKKLADKLTAAAARSSS